MIPNCDVYPTETKPLSIPKCQKLKQELSSTFSVIIVTLWCHFIDKQTTPLLLMRNLWCRYTDMKGMGILSLWSYILGYLSL